MYCSSCGIEVTQELNYCNRCGANLSPQTSLVTQVVAPPVRLTAPIIALGAMVVLSLAAIFGGAESMALKGVSAAAIAWMVIISVTMVFGVTSLLIKLLASLHLNQSRLVGQPHAAQLKQPQPNAQLPAAQTGSMQAPISSVTDHTTRTFEPALRERARRG
jgi:hypothetical protein